MSRTNTFALVLAVLTLGMFPTASHAKAGSVTSLSNPPGKATRTFTLRVNGTASRVTLFAAAVRRHARSDVKLATLAVRGHKVKITLPRRLSSGAYFIIACPATGRGACAASRKATVLLPKLSSVLHNGKRTLRTSGSASGTIGEAGGTLRVSAPGGTVTLQIPRRSLANTGIPSGCTLTQVSGFWRRACTGSTALTGPKVTVTPLSALSGVGSLGRFVAGAQLQPDRLPLIRGATVTLAPKRAISKAKMVAVAYTGTGTGIHRVPMRISRGQAVVALGELGGGVAILEKGTTASKGTAALVVPSALTTAATGSGGLTAVYQDLIAAKVEALRASGHDLGDGSQEAQDTASAMFTALDDMYNDVITQEVPAGMTSDEAAQTAIRDLLNVLRTQQLFGAGGEKGGDVLVKLLKAAYNRAQERCVSQSPAQLDRSLADIIGAARALALLGADENLTWDELTVCAQFTMTFDSTITTVWGGQNHGTHVNEYRIVARLAVEPDGTTKGEAPGTYVQTTGTATVDPQDCGDGSGTYVGHNDLMGGTGDLAQVPALILPFGGKVAKLQLQLGFPMETYHQYATGACSGDAPPAKLPLWSGMFQFSHMNDGTISIDGRSAYVFVLDGPATGATMASKAYDRTFTTGGNTYTERTTITVTHTPGKYKPYVLK